MERAGPRVRVRDRIAGPLQRRASPTAAARLAERTDGLLLRRTKTYSLPPLGVGIAIYLPPAVTLPVVLGAFVGWLYDRKVAKGPHGPAAQRLGVLLASGFIVGESLWGVLYAGIVGGTGESSPLAIVGDGLGDWMQLIGVVVFVIFVGGVYRYVKHFASEKDPVETSVDLKKK